MDEPRETEGEKARIERRTKILFHFGFLHLFGCFGVCLKFFCFFLVFFFFFFFFFFGARGRAVGILEEFKKRI